MSRKHPGVFRARYRDRHGKYQFSRTWFVSYNWLGKRIREKTGLLSEAEAWKFRLRRLAEINAGRFVGPSSDKLVVADLQRLTFDSLKAEGKKTADSLHKWFKPLGEHFGTTPVVRIVLADLNAYVASRDATGAARGTVKVELAWLKRGWRLAWQSKMLPEVPPFPKIQVDNARRVFADWAVVTAMLPFLPEYLRPVILTAHVSGWRKEAILSRRRDDLDLTGRWLYLDRAKSKGKSPVRIWLTGMLHEALTEQDRLAKEVEISTRKLVPWLFFYPEDRGNAKAGERIVDFDSVWREARARAGLNVRFHDLRRGAIRTLRRAGLSEHEVMTWCGLKTRAVFDRYDVIDEVRIKDMGEKLEKYQGSEEKDAAERMRRFPS